MPTHPYKGLPAEQFWSTAMRPVAAADLDPAGHAKFTVAPGDPVATAGSCFAQHLAQHLPASGFTFLQTEEPGVTNEPVYSARFGNIYTVRQLHQLMLGAFGLHRPQIRVWRRADGRFIDPVRPQLFPDAFRTPEEVVDERKRHLAAVRRLFQECRVFVFTLGLTEAWLASDGTVLPVPPGVVDVDLPGAGATFVNFTADDMRRDMDAFLADLDAVNPGVRVILTVSPVPLVATYEKRHVLVANTYGKAALRVVADDAARTHANVAYFPAYEIVTAPQVRGAYYEADLRGITAAGTAHIMRVFTTHFLQQGQARLPQPAPRPEPVITDAARAEYAELVEITADEDMP